MRHCCWINAPPALRGLDLEAAAGTEMDRWDVDREGNEQSSRKRGAVTADYKPVKAAFRVTFLVKDYEMKAVLWNCGKPQQITRSRLCPESCGVCGHVDIGRMIRIPKHQNNRALEEERGFRWLWKWLMAPHVLIYMLTYLDLHTQTERLKRAKLSKMMEKVKRLTSLLHSHRKATVTKMFPLFRQGMMKSSCEHSDHCSTLTIAAEDRTGSLCCCQETEKMKGWEMWPALMSVGSWCQS